MFGHYNLVRQLGEGGYANVYLCKDEVGVRYACKSLPKKKNSYERVRKEIDVMKRLQTLPMVVKYVDDGENDLSYYIVQEWCRGGSLYEHLHSGDVKNHHEANVVNVTRSILQALYHMHKNNVIHGDIKASNVLVSGVHNGEFDVRLCDFGNSLVMVDDIVQVSSLVGTPEFMAPENLRSNYHRSSDIWSLGVMVYEMICGRLPFTDHIHLNNPSLPLLCKSILEDNVTFKESAWMEVSDDAKDFVARCLDKDYQQRPLPFECLEHKWIS